MKSYGHPPPISILIAGAQRSGTTSLLRCLGRHPQIAAHPQREFSFFVNPKEYREGYHRAHHRYFGGLAPKPNAKFLLAKSVGIMVRPDAMGRLRAHNPDVRIVVILRNPVDRAWSAYWFARRCGLETIGSFEEALTACRNHREDGWIQAGAVDYLGRGMYHHHLKTLFRRFPPHQISVVIFDDYIRQPDQVIASLLAGWGLEVPDGGLDATRENPTRTTRCPVLSRWLLGHPALGAAIRRMIGDRTADRCRNLLSGLGDHPFQPPPMDPETRQRLTNLYRPLNERLSDLLGRDFSNWNRCSATLASFQQPEDRP